MSEGASILVVEDEPAVAGFVRQALDEAGYRPRVARTLAEAESKLREEAADAVILDWMLPDGSGLDFVGRVKESGDVPVLMLTARSGMGDRVAGLDAGADDYLVKPFGLEELMARIRALLRRRRSEAAIRIGDLELNPTTRRVARGGRLLFLSTTEYSLLELLARRHGEPVSKAAILRHVWDDDGRDPNVVEVYVNYLRHKLERGGAPRLLHTIRGRGYALAAESPE